MNLNIGDLLFLMVHRIRKGKYILLFTVLFGAAIGVTLKIMSPTRYEARSLFYPDKDAALSGSPLEVLGGNFANRAGFLGLFTKVLNTRYISTIIVSREITEPEYAGKYELLADWILEDEYQATKKPWSPKKDFKKLKKSERIDQAAALFRSGAFGIIDETGFLSLMSNASNSELAIYINKAIIKQLIAFNKDIQISQAEKDYFNIKHRCDSIGEIYFNLNYEYANFNDVNRFMVKQTVKLPQEQLARRRAKIEKRYDALLDAMEQAFLRLNGSDRLIKIVDTPYISSVQEPSKMTGGIIFGAIGLLVGVLFLIRKEIWYLINNTLLGLIPKPSSEQLLALENAEKGD